MGMEDLSIDRTYDPSKLRWTVPLSKDFYTYFSKQEMCGFTYFTL